MKTTLHRVCALVVTISLLGLQVPLVQVVHAATPPIVGFNITPQPGDTTTLFFFDASTSINPDNINDPLDNLEVRYDFENDGTFDTAYTTIKGTSFQATHTYTTAATYTVLAEVRNTSSGLTATNIEFLTVQSAGGGGGQTPPTADLFALPGTGDTTTQFVFHAEQSTDQQTSTALLEYEYHFGDGNQTVFQQGQTTASHVYTQVGQYTAFVIVKDEDGMTDQSQDVTVTVSDPVNLPPSITSSATPSAPNISEQVTFTVDLAPDNPPSAQNVTARIDFDGSGPIPFTSFMPLPLNTTHTYLSAGTYTVNIEAQDDDGQVTLSTIPLTVSDPGGSNTPPIVGLVINPNTGDTNTLFFFDASTSIDPDNINDPLAGLDVRFDFENNATWTAWTPIVGSSQGSHQYTTAGTKQINVEVRDSAGAVSSNAFFLTVAAGGGTGGDPIPVASLTVAPNSNITTNTQLTFDASLSSDDQQSASQLEYKYDFGDGNATNFILGNLTTAYQYATTGDFTASVVVKDADGNISPPATLAIHVDPFTGNQPPVISACTPSSPFPPANTPVTFTITATDDATPTNLLAYRIDVDGPGPIPFTSFIVGQNVFSQVNGNPITYSTNGIVPVTVEVRDASGATTTSTDCQVDVGGTPPPPPPAPSGPTPAELFYIFRRHSRHRGDGSGINKGPKAKIVVNKDSGQMGDIFQFSGRKSKDDRDYTFLLFRFDVDGDGEWDTPFRHEGKVAVRFHSEGVHKVMVQVRDTSGLMSQATQEVAVGDQFIQDRRREQLDFDLPNLAKFRRPEPTEQELVNPDLLLRIRQLKARHRQLVLRQRPLTLRKEKLIGSLLFTKEISNPVLRHNDITTETITIKNVSNHDFRNVRLLEQLKIPSNGGRVLRVSSSFAGSTFFPEIIRGNIDTGDVTFKNIPAYQTLRITIKLRGNTYSMLEGSMSHITSSTYLVNMRKQHVMTITLDKSNTEDTHRAAQLLTRMIQARKEEYFTGQ